MTAEVPAQNSGEREPTPEQAVRNQFAGFVEDMLDAQVSGDPEKTLAIFTRGFLEQNSDKLPPDVVGRLSDKRLEVVRRINQRPE
jgi:hypothetical protein